MNIGDTLSTLSQNNRALMGQAVDRGQQNAEKRKAIADAIMQEQMRAQQRAMAANDTSLKIGSIINTTA